LNVYLTFLAIDLVIDPIDTCNGSYGVVWIILSSLSSKGFINELLPTSNKERSETLKVAVTSYSHGRSTLYALSLILLRKWNDLSPFSINLDFLCSRNLFFSYMHLNSTIWLKNNPISPFISFECKLLIFLICYLIFS